VLSSSEREWLRDLTGIDPGQEALYRAALTHRSADDESYERLEFLGDAVLGMLIADVLYEQFPDADEGTLSRLRSQLVSSGPLAQIGAAIGVGPLLRLGSGELRSGGFRRESILADATEALIAAVYRDRGIQAARTFVRRLFDDRIAALQPEQELKDSKTRLQELLQGRGEMLPAYVLDSTSGEPHEQWFRVRCCVQLQGADDGIEAPGAGLSRRRAEQEAAAGVLQQLTERWAS
jgi:ribonuclease-3